MRKRNTLRESIIDFIVNTGRIPLITGEEMSSIKINSSRDLETFLRILAEESVSDAHSKIQELRSVDPAQEYYSGERQKSEIKKFLEEQEEEDPEEEELPEDPKGSKLATLDIDPELTDDEPVDASASRASIRDEINDLRAGFSTKREKVTKNLDAYLERLDDLEVKILDKFLQALSDILNLRVSGDDAPDPSEILGIEYVLSKKDSPEEARPQEQELPGEMRMKEPRPEGFETEEEEEEEKKKKDLEDITPPVRVGSPQKLAEIRQKVRRLMLM